MRDWSKPEYCQAAFGSSHKTLVKELFADYFQFYIQDENVSGDLSNEWTKDAEEKASLVKQAALADQQALAEVPKLYQEGFEKYADHPLVFVAAAGMGVGMSSMSVTTSPLRQVRLSSTCRTRSGAGAASPAGSWKLAVRHQPGTRIDRVHGAAGVSRTVTRMRPPHGYGGSVAMRTVSPAIVARSSPPAN